MKEQPVGFLDSGLGGLSVVKEVKKLLPRENIEYFADNQRQPYGEKNQSELIKFTFQIISFLLKKKIKICETYEIAREYLKPLKEAQIDALILGCTHYSFLIEVISEIMGPEVKLIDPAVSTTLELKEILIQKEILNEQEKVEENYYTTGSPEKVGKTAKIILNSDNFKIQKVKLKELE